MDDYAYHATSAKNLPSIRKRGLVPEVNWGLVDYISMNTGQDPATISVPPMLYFFLGDQEMVMEYGDTILRFPEPADAYDAEPEWGTVGFVTQQTVPPSVIELWDADSESWHPLVRRR